MAEFCPWFGVLLRSAAERKTVVGRRVKQMINPGNRFGWFSVGDTCPWNAACGRHVAGHQISQSSSLQCSTRPSQLYTPEQRRRRDASGWTIVQGVLAPLQFMVFLISLTLVLHFVLTGRGLHAASLSVLVKTGCLYAIMVTGAIWEHEVFGRYLFAPAFFWEDAFSMLVLALHTLYIVALLTGHVSPHGLMLLALGAYASYAINATQFVLKLRLARREAPMSAAC